MIRKILIVHDYIEGSAGSNRVLCFAKGYRDNGKEVHLMLFGSQGCQVPKIEGVNVEMFYEPHIPLRITRRLIAIFCYVKAIKKKYQQSSTIIHIYRTPWWGFFFFNKKKYNFFYERGEVPFFASNRSLSYLFQEYIGRGEAKTATGMFAQTHSLKEYYRNYGVNNSEVINMFVDTSRFENLTIDKSTKYIAYCGTICKHKDGVDDLIKAFDVVHQTHPEYMLYLIGAFEALYGDEEYLRNMVKERDLNAAVVFTGRVKPTDIPGLLANASILALARPVNPQTQYGFPTKLGEYLCTGNPIVLTDVGEIGLYLKDHLNCLFAQPDNYKDFAEKLLWTVENYDEAKKLGDAGRSLVDSDFSILAQTKKAIDFMERVSNPRI